jgi:hypothetical protein
MSRFMTALALSASVAFSISAAAQANVRATMPPKTGQEITPLKLVPSSNTASVNVVLLTSWGTTSGWTDLQTEWQNYGTTPLTIDDTTYIDSDFTYQDLVNSGADVIVLSDPAGGEKQYTSAEIAAVQQYAKTGHTVLGTFLVFEWSSTDDTGLLPVFGFTSVGQYTQESIDNTFYQVKSQPCLFQNIPSPWQSDGYAYSQVPTPALEWGDKALNLATLEADSDGSTGIVTVYNAANYTAVYISNYPEYYGGTYDLQLLYNSVTCFTSQK